MQQFIKFGFLSACVFALAVIATGCKKNNGFAHQPGAPMKVDSFTPASGGLGTEILISGNNFSTDTNAITVIINGHQLKVVNANEHQIMAVVPARCGSGHVIVKIGSDSTVSAGLFNYSFSRIVSTFAGDGTAGFANGHGTDARFNFNGQSWYRSMGIAVDDKLNVYVADVGNHCIRKIDSAGNVTILAGNPNVSGYADGKGLAAAFSIPYDVAVDASGNVWTADPGNGDIRKISPDGDAVTWTWSSIYPWSVAVDPTTGIPYFSACSSPASIYQAPTENGETAVISGLVYPSAIRFDRNGNLFTVGNGDNLIHKFSVGTWNHSVVAGNGTAGYVDGPSTVAEFSVPWGMGIDAAGNLYVAGNGTWDGGAYNPDQSIRYIDIATGTVSTFAGSGTAAFVNGAGSLAAFSGPGGVAVDKNGTAYVLDKNNNCIRKIISQ